MNNLFQTITSQDWRQAFARARNEPNKIRQKIMETHFNQLTPAQTERLDVLAEECAEVIQAVCKIKRHGYASHNPDDETQTSNRDHLMRELGNVDCAIQMLSDAGEVDLNEIDKQASVKTETIGEFLHHQ